MNENATILLVDDTRSSLLMLEADIVNLGYHVLTADSGIRAIEVLDENPADLIISDQVMPGMDGIELLHRVREKHLGIPFIILTAYGSISKAVFSMQHGADDYITKPYEIETIAHVIRRSLNYGRLSREHRELKNYLKDLHGFQNIITRDPCMKEPVGLALKVAKTPDTDVLIYGESGTGKELFARAIHSASGRMETRFAAINCAGIPEGLLETELFGHVKGAFTGAGKDRQGKFGLAQNGTLLLDEIGDMPLLLQGKILRVLQERAYEKVGSDRMRMSNARIIAATHRNLEQMVREGKFRADLFHRLNRFQIFLPPLRKRKADIPLLADFFIRQFRREFGKSVPGISEKAMECILNHSWPGNVRELKNCLERAVIISDNELIRSSHLTLPCKEKTGPKAADEPESPDKIHLRITLDRETFSLETLTDHVLNMILEKCNQNKSQAAALLKVHRNIFYRRK